jgi:hypothetical protein
MLLATVPYYRSTYVFAYRGDAGFRIDSFDSAELKRRRIGVQIVGDDCANTPPAHALARRGVISNVAGFRVADDYSREDPPARIIEARRRGDIDVAVAWGPLAGYFGKKLGLNPRDRAGFTGRRHAVPAVVFHISMGVRRGEDSFKRELDRALHQLEPEIRTVFADITSHCSSGKDIYWSYQFHRHGMRCRRCHGELRRWPKVQTPRQESVPDSV